jgi:flagellar biosynthesis protein FlhF
MRVLNQITFEAKDDAEALRLASERLGKDAVILSTRTVRVGGFMGLFQRHVLMVSAGILQDEQKEEKNKEKTREKDDTAAKERLVAFQKLLEFKQATETRTGSGGSRNLREMPELPLRQNALSEGAGKVIYSPAGVDLTTSNKNVPFDSVHISPAGLTSIGMDAVASQKSLPRENGMVDSLKLKEEVHSLSKRLDTVLQHLKDMKEKPMGVDKGFEAGLPGISARVERNSERNNEREDLYERLLSAEIDAVYARKLTEEYQEHKGSILFERWLESKIRCATDISSNILGGQKVMLLGPTGVGKTTTLAKLAAIQALWEHKNVLLLTSDTYRIAAVDQLRTYAKILGVPMEVIFEVENFTHILEEHADTDLILLDTAGRGQRDRKSLEALEVIYNVFKPDATHLVLAANMKYKDMLDVVERMSIVPISHVIFTKLDETVSYGAVFNVLKSLDRPVSFFTTGQNVPNDIEVASSARLVSFLMSDKSRRNTL